MFLRVLLGVFQRVLLEGLRKCNFCSGACCGFFQRGLLRGVSGGFGSVLHGKCSSVFVRVSCGVFQRSCSGHRRGRQAHTPPVKCSYVLQASSRGSREKKVRTVGNHPIALRWAPGKKSFVVDFDELSSSSPCS